MSKPLLSRFLLATLALLFASTALAQSRRGYVRLTRIGPTISVEDNATKEEILRLENQPSEEIKILEKNTVITVGPGSRVILVFSNGATLNVKEESTLNIQAFRQDPFAGSYDPKTATEEPNAKSRTEIFLQKGELIGNVKTLREDSVFKVSTPAGAAGIRGTTFRVVYRPSGTGQAFFSVTTLEGDVGVTTTEGTVDAPISVVDDQEVVIVVEVDDTTGEVTVVTPIEEIAPANADPAVLADMTAAVQESAEAVVDIVMTAETDQDDEPVADEGESDEGDDESTSEESEDDQDDEGDEADESEDSGQSDENADTEDQNDEGTDEGEGTDDGSTEGADDGSTDGSDGSTPSEGDTAGNPQNPDNGNNDSSGGDTGEGEGNTPNPPANDPPPATTQPDNPSDLAGAGG